MLKILKYKTKKEYNLQYDWRNGPTVWKELFNIFCYDMVDSLEEEPEDFFRRLGIFKKRGSFERVSFNTLEEAENFLDKFNSMCIAYKLTRKF